MDRDAGLEPMAIVGDTPNIAARLQAFAEPNTLVISASTHRLIESFFDCRDLGLHTLEGIAQPIVVYQVLHEREVQTLTGLTPLVGREQEIGLLLEHWEQVMEGTGQGILLSGEAGIGKSRLVQVLKCRSVAAGVSLFTLLSKQRALPDHQSA
jgi:predicted AAA+ superfamily ATPase